MSQVLSSLATESSHLLGNSAPVEAKSKVSTVAESKIPRAVLLAAEDYSLQNQTSQISLTHQNYFTASHTLFFLGVAAGILGIVSPFFLIGAAALLLAGVACKVRGNQLESRCMQHIQELKQTAIDHVRSAPERIAFAEQSLNAEEIKKVSGKYTKKQLMDFARLDNHFAGFQKGYFHRIGGVAEQPHEDYLFTMYRHYVTTVLGAKEGASRAELRTHFNTCLVREENPELQNKALHLSAFLKLLGEHNRAFPQGFNESTLEDREVRLNIEHSKENAGTIVVPPLHAGSLGISFSVDGEKFTLSSMEGEELARYQAPRNIRIEMPKANGDVAFIIERDIKRVN